MERKVIDLDEYKRKKYSEAMGNIKPKYSFDEEERKETLDLFIKVLETMEKESRYKV